MRSCKNCKKYTKEICSKYNIRIIDKINAQYCKFYEEKRNIKQKIKCCWCKNLNKYLWCSHKKRCLNDTEIEKERTCVSFYKKNKKDCH